MKTNNNPYQQHEQHSQDITKYKATDSNNKNLIKDIQKYTDVALNECIAPTHNKQPCSHKNDKNDRNRASPHHHLDALRSPCLECFLLKLFVLVLL
ncbi:Hypothetical predicted protein [Octopus vulgaris]|uniref:Uncharacterized protein n=1 Tax=Octopus vulgaris TaxID=6645 RepID=A0AA36F9Z6_OCTVU|nr:Hypothetical predicted protein [Octopus vulgaris]